MPSESNKHKKFPTIGCCGIDCGLCPRFYTEGKSRCPGCGGDGFEGKHPPCSIKSCCVGKHGLEVCGQCAEFPCPKYADKEKIERDSFVTHKRIFQNHEFIKTHGIDMFTSKQNKRISILQDMLTKYDDGRSKGYFCLAAALLSIDSLRNAMALAGKGENLRTVLKQFAEAEGRKLILKKVEGEK